MYTHTHTPTHWTLVPWLIMAIWCLSWSRRRSQPSVSWRCPRWSLGGSAQTMLAEAVGFHVEDFGEPRSLLQSLKERKKNGRKDVWITDNRSLMSPTLTQWGCFLPLTATPVCILKTKLRRSDYDRSGLTSVEHDQPKDDLNTTGELWLLLHREFDKNNPAMLLLPPLKRLYNGCEQVHHDEHNIRKLTHKVDINKIGGFSTRASASRAWLGFQRLSHG